MAIAPPLIEDSEKVGVDTLVAAMCLLTIWLSLRVLEQPTVARAALAGLAGGLAVSSKYNAIPVVVVPVLAVFLSGRLSAGTLVAALGLPAVGFVAGTPYALINLPAFLDGMAYEVNHYAIRGHGGATVESGWLHAARFPPVDVQSGERRRRHGRRPSRDVSAAAVASPRGVSNSGLPRPVRPLHVYVSGQPSSGTCLCCCRSLLSRRSG